MKKLWGWVSLVGVLSLSTVWASDGPAIGGQPPLKPVLVFDLDRTLFDPTPRIAAINHSVGYPGSRQEYSDRKTRHGGRFLLDPRYMVWDRPLAGAAEFVARAQKALDADILYLTGRINERMWDATVDQLRRGNFPGYGSRGYLRNRVSLWLKPEREVRPTSEFKVQLLSRIAPPWRVAMIAEDSTRNLSAFEAAGYTAENGVQLLRIALGGLPPVLPHPDSRTLVQGYDSAGDLKKLQALIEKAKGCSQMLLEPYFRGE